MTEYNISEVTEQASTSELLAASADFDASEYTHFMLRMPNEIIQILRGISDRVSQITVFFNEGRDMLLTTLAEVTENHLILDFGPDQETNRKALATEKQFCVTMPDKVRVQFILRGLREIEHEGRRAFRADLPDEVLRLQRREYFRLITPVMHPLKCLMPIPLPDGKMHLHDAHVYDISGGGVGISAPADNIPFITGMDIQHCRIELPEVGFITVTLRISSIFNVTLRSGAKARRAGCEFVNAPGATMNLVHRYIIKVERERKARVTGLG